MGNPELNRLALVLGLLGTGVALTSGCSASFSEKYYVGVFEGPGDGSEEMRATQFYRFTLSGWSSLFSNTRYEAGWYDADVVERLFGEIRDMPTAKGYENANAVPSADDKRDIEPKSLNSNSPEASLTSETEGSAGSAAGQPNFFRFGPEGVARTLRQDERFVIFMHSDPRALVGRIKALVNSKKAQAVVAQVILGPKIVEQEKTIDETNSSVASAKRLVTAMKEFVGSQGYNDESAKSIRNTSKQWLIGLNANGLGLIGVLGVGAASDDQ